MVAHGKQGLRRLVGHLGAAVEVRLPRFSGRRAVSGRPGGEVGGPERGASGWWPRGERGWFKEEKPFFFLLLHHVQGGRRKRNSTVQNGTVRSLFFFMYETASFQLKMAPERAKFQISPQLSFVYFNCVPANFGLCPSCCRVFHFSPWPLIYAIEPSID